MMIKSEQGMVDNMESAYKLPNDTGGMLHQIKAEVEDLDYNEDNRLHNDYCNVQVKVEVDDDKGLQIYPEPQSPERKINQFFELQIHYPQPEIQGMNNQCLGVEIFPDCENQETKVNQCIVNADGNFGYLNQFQADRIKEIYSFLQPMNVQSGGSNFTFSQLTKNQLPVVQQVRKKDKRSARRIPKKNRPSPMTPLQIEKLLRRREYNRQRKALTRAMETEEQRNLRREKDRLSKAARRAKEPLAKKLKRNERERLAKRALRAAETEEQRQIRRDKHRRRMAERRASESAEERFIRMEKDRLNKAMARYLETEEERIKRRERNRISVAIRRANLSEEEKNYRRYTDRVAKRASRFLRATQETPIAIETPLFRERDPLELPKKPKKSRRCSEPIIPFVAVIGEPLDLENGSNGEEDSEEKNKDKVMSYIEREFIFLENPSTSNESTPVSSFNQL